jgi:hypothetical protein
MSSRTKTVLIRGLIAAVAAHLAIAAVLIVGDLTSGRSALFTPSLLGQVLLRGTADACEVQGGLTPLLSYAAIHFAALAGFGVLASYLIQKSEDHPGIWFGAWLVFFVVAWHLGGAVVLMLAPVRGCVSLGWFFGASVAGAAAMAGYLWGRHPRLRGALRDDQYA